VVQAPGASLDSWTTNLTAANLVAGLAVLAAAFAGLGLLHFALTARQLRRDLAAAAAASGPVGLQVGDQAPAFELPDLTGTTTSLDRLRETGRPLVLLFASPVCGPCAEILPQFERWSVALSEQLGFAVIESLVPDASALGAQFAHGSNVVVLTEPDLGVASEYNVAQTPTAFLIAADGRVAAAGTVGAGAIERLVRNALQTQPVDVREVA
jgi:peroxiredoxin